MTTPLFRQQHRVYLVRRVPRLVPRHVPRHIRLLSVTPNPRLPPKPKPKSKPDQHLSILQQYKADIEDAQARGLVRTPPAHYNGVTRFFMTTAYLLGFYARGIIFIFMRQYLRLYLDRTNRTHLRALHIQRQDIKKVVPFMFIALLFEEAIPFIVAYAPGLLPSSCILPGQEARIRRQKVEQARKAQAALREVVQRVRKNPDAYGYDGTGITVDPLHHKIGCVAFRDCKQEVVQTMGLGAFGPWTSPGRTAYCVKDDYLFLAGAAHVNELTEEELDQALFDRGLIIPDQTSMQAKQGILKWYLNEILQSGSNTLSFRIALVARFASLSKDLLK